MKIAILMPMHKQMDAPCIQSLLNFQCDLFKAGHEVLFFIAYGFNAARARQGLTRECAEHKTFNPEYVLWLDSDHLYLKKDFDTLLKTIEEKDLKMLSGSYKMRGSEETAHGIHKDGVFGHIHYKELNEMPYNTIYECDVVGFGFLLMKYSFLQDMWNKYKDDLFKLDIGDNGTEDVTFCKLAQKEGVKVAFHPKVRIGHTELCIRI